MAGSEACRIRGYMGFQDLYDSSGSCYWKSDSFAPTLILVGADTGIRCSSAAAGCKSTILWLNSAVFIRGAEPSRTLSALDKSQFLMSSEILCWVLAFCCASVRKAVFYKFWYGFAPAKIQMPLVF